MAESIGLIERAAALLRQRDAAPAGPTSLHEFDDEVEIRLLRARILPEVGHIGLAVRY